MGSYIVFYLILSMILHNPILALIVIAILYYVVDRRFIGLTPSVTKPFRRRMRIAHLRREIAANPHDSPAKYDLARSLMERGNYRGALELIESLPASMQEADDVQVDWGVCQLHLGQQEDGEARILSALTNDSALRRGEPYLQMASALSGSAPDRALRYLQTFQQYNVSSCESLYRLGLLLSQFGDGAGARQALRQCIDTYRALPKFRRRVERRWFTLARLKLMGASSGRSR